MKPPQLLLVLAILLASMQSARAQFTAGQPVFVKVYGEPREGKIVRKLNDTQWLVEGRNALTGKYDGTFQQAFTQDEISTAPPANIDPNGYGNSEGGMQGNAGGGKFNAGQIVNYTDGFGKPAFGKVVQQNQYGVLVEIPNGQTGKFEGASQYLKAEQLTAGAPIPQAQVLAPQAVQQRPVAFPTTPAMHQPAVPAFNPPAQQFNPPAQPHAANLGGAQGGGGAPMGQAEVLNFLKQRLGAGPVNLVDFAVREKAYSDLVNEIQKRGVDFKYVVASQFSNDIGRLLVPTAVISAISKNYGAPKSQNWYYGTWNMTQVGGTNQFTKNTTVWENQEYGGKSGKLVIDPQGRYTWGDIQGTWRAATRPDFKGIEKGGDGIVLTNAKTGTNWIMLEDDMAGGTSIRVSEVGFPDHSERGGR